MLEKHGLPTANFGLHAGFGSHLLIESALGEVRPGDTFIIAVEPPLLTKPYEMSSFACKLAYATGNPCWAYKPWEKPFLPFLGSLIRCNTGWKWLMLFPNVRRKALEENHSSQFQMDSSGWQTIEFHPSEFSPIPVYPGHLSDDNRKLLEWIRRWCDSNNIRVAYSLPWMFENEGPRAAQFRNNNASLLKEIASIIPVLKDPRLGICPQRQSFSNTLFHLNAEAAALRTDELARQIQGWEVWSHGELDSLEREHLPK